MAEPTGGRFAQFPARDPGPMRREFGLGKTSMHTEDPVVPGNATAPQQAEQVGSHEGERRPPGFARDEQICSPRRQSEQSAQGRVRKLMQKQILEHDVHRGCGLIQPGEHIRCHTRYGPAERGKRVMRSCRNQILAIQQRDLGGDAPGGPETRQR